MESRLNAVKLAVESQQAVGEYPLKIKTLIYIMGTAGEYVDLETGQRFRLSFIEQTERV